MHEKEIQLLSFEPRDYQIPFMDAILNKKYRRAFICWGRRSGKDITAFNILFRMAMKEIGNYAYVFPTFAAGRRILWDNVTTSGKRLLDYIPAELIASKNDQQMKLWMRNGSQIIVLGSSDWDDSITGTNFRGVILSEYAQQDPNCWQMALSPILNQNRGWACFLSTPRGKNHFWDLKQIAEGNPDDWFYSHLTVDDTKHIDRALIDRDIETGVISKEKALQEYWCDFSLGIDGSFYGDYIDKMRLDGRIGNIPWDPSHPVHVSFDIGIRDVTAVIFAQYINNALYILESFEEANKGLDYFIKIVKSKEYQFGKFFAPCDIHVREYTSGRTRYDIARQLGMPFTTVGIQGANNSFTPFGLADSIEVVRTMLPRTYIDATKNKRLIRALESYRKEFDYKYNAYKNKPVHDEYSHMADSFRYLCLGTKKMRPGMSDEDKQAYNAHLSPNITNLPPALNKDFHFRR